MNNLTWFDQYCSLENMCNKILQEEGVRFAGIINKMGKLEIGGFGEGIIPHEDPEKQKMMFMQFVLMCNMRKENDDTSGHLDYILTKRKKATMLCIPMNKKVLLLSVEPNMDINKITDKLMKIHSFGKDNHVINEKNQQFQLNNGGVMLEHVTKT